jgi:hypothetical protein
MPRAVAVGLPEPSLRISASPKGYQSHFSHPRERIWLETNCYLEFGSKHFKLGRWIKSH